jgi:Zn-dependent protease with chaperone function
MSEVAFPILGALFVFLIVLPAFTLVAAAAAFVLERSRWSGSLRHLGLRYVLFISSSLLPLSWFISAGLHQAETPRSVLACLFDHQVAELCLEPVLFTLLLLSVALGSAMAVFRRVEAMPKVEPGAGDTQHRVARLIATHPELIALDRRVDVTNEASFAIGTFGWLRPRVVIGSAFAERLTDPMLLSALGHERLHVVSRDPLRYWVLNLALAVNPFGRWLLHSQVARWYSAREAHCDREAVLHGAEPLSLADAIVLAARPRAFQGAALGAHSATALKLRVEMLIAFTESAPVCCRRDSKAFPIAVALVLLSLMLPHHMGTHALDALHTGAESAFTLLVP